LYREWDNDMKDGKHRASNVKIPYGGIGDSHCNRKVEKKHIHVLECEKIWEGASNKGLGKDYLKKRNPVEKKGGVFQ
jgi:hypothetical protein